MGVTIHFEGQLSSLDNFDKVISVAKNFAENNHWEYFEFKEDYKLLERVKDEKDWNYEGSTKGLQLQPDLIATLLYCSLTRIYMCKSFVKLNSQT